VPLPQLTPDASTGLSVPPPPPRHRPLRGVPRFVKWRSSGATGSQGLTDAQKAGLRYEAKAQDFLSGALHSWYHVAPYLHFDDAGLSRTLVPDGILFDHDGTAMIFEIKSQHMPEAWWQLRKLYEPVVRELSFVNATSCIEVTKSYDPSMGFPEEVLVCHSLSELVAAPAHCFKVFVWRP
jgi:hypothetical protein